MTDTVVHFVDSADFGGAERVVLTLAAGADRRRWRSLVFHHAGAARLQALARAEGIETREVPRREARRGIGRLVRLARELRRARPAVFHAHLNWPGAGLDGLVAAALARVPAVVATQQLWPPHHHGRLRLQQAMISRLVGRHVAVSAAIARQLALAGCRPDKIRVIHNGVPIPPLADPRAADARVADAGRGGLAPGAVVLTVARLDTQKDLLSLVSAAALVRDAVFLVAGEGGERPVLEAQARLLGVAGRVRFLGHRPDVPALLAGCDAFVLPSLFEGLPLSVLEAMAAGKPVIASAVPGTLEVVDPERTGLLVPPGDPAELADAIRRVLADRGLAERLGAAGRVRVGERFSAEVMIQRTAALYEELLSAGRPSWRSAALSRKPSAIAS